MSIRKKWQKRLIILVMADGKLRELQKKLKGDCTLEICNDQRSYRICNLQKNVPAWYCLRAIYDVAGKETVEKVDDPLFRRIMAIILQYMDSGRAVLDQAFPGSM